MCPAIDNLASCEIRALIRFLHTKNTSAVEIRLQLCAAVYGQNAMSEGTFKRFVQWLRRLMSWITVIIQHPVALTNNLILRASLEVATSCRFRRLFLCYVVTFLRK
jgi:hypothetical protein